MTLQQYGFDFEPDKCVQCHACEIACKTLHNAQPRIQWRRVVGLWRGDYPNLVSRTLSLSCMHCGEPACEAVCPTHAITKRVEDGIVLVDPDKCIGCRSCFLACPFGVPQFGADGRMQKCDLCVDLLIEGKEPACVSTCPADALHFGPMDELASNKRERASDRVLTPFLASGACMK